MPSSPRRSCASWKTATRQEQKLVRQEHVANRQGVQAGLVMSMFGRKAAAADRIAKREASKAEQAVALQPYDDLVRLIDRSVIELDRLILQLKPKAAVKTPGKAKSAGAKMRPPELEVDGAVAPSVAMAPGEAQEAVESPARAVAAIPEAGPTPASPPLHQPLIIHADTVAESAVVAEWWLPQDGYIESRNIRFYGPDGIWLRGDDLPPSLEEAGCSVTKVAGVTHQAGIVRTRA